ncbi:MAG: 30S ribosomal protein S6 [Elusimicrobiaceae bacterium]|jgi:small subunit ribosomal protein S6
MHSYEQITILKPQLSDKEIAEFVAKTKECVTGNGGEVISEEAMGRKKLAHPIHHTRDGYYSYLKYKCSDEALAALRYQNRINENILRSIIFKSPEK